MSELALGTVQFGLNYGVTNHTGEISDAMMASMLKLANQRGIQLFDTAADYGISQKRLGSIPEFSESRKYVTKFSLPQDGSPPTEANIFQNSMQQLKAEHLYAVLFHKLQDLSDSRCSATLEVLREGRNAQKIDRIGVSIYNTEDLALALEVFPDLDIIQLPANALDLRLLESSELQEVRSRGTEIHVRSIFLQGLLLSNPDALSEYFSPLKPALLQLNKIAENTGKSVLELLLGKMRGHSFIDAVLVGATSVSELEEVISGWESSSDIEDFELPLVPNEILDPRGWPQIRMNP